MSTRKKVDITRWRKMMEPRYKQIDGFRTQWTKNYERMMREKIALRTHVEKKLRYGNKDPNAAARKIQTAFKSFMKDSEKREAKLSKELNNLLENYLKPKLKRERNSKNNNANSGPTKRIRHK